MAAIEPIFISVKDAAEALALSRWAVYKKLDEGAIEGKYEGSRRLVVVKSLREYADGLHNTPAPVEESA